MEELFNTLPKILSFECDAEIREAIVIAVWKKLMNNFGEKAFALRLEDDTLVVAVVNEDWKWHLEKLSSEIIFKINSAVQYAAVRRLSFHVDRNMTGGKIAKKPSGKLDSKALLGNIQSSANLIIDEQLRLQFLNAAAACLIRKEKLENSSR
jgi:hypothetical protein